MPILGITASSFFENTPPVTSGLTHWYDASDSSTMTISSGNISQWNNKSPASGGPNLTQTTGSKQPDLETNIRVGRSAVRFKDANEDHMSSTSQPTTGTSPFTVCIAAKATDTNVDQYIVSWGTSNFAGGGWANVFWGDEKLVGSYAGNRDVAGIVSANTYNDTWFTMITTVSNLTLQAWFQREAKSTDTSTAANISSNSEFLLGWLTNPWYATYGYDGYIGDVLIYNRVLTDSEAVDVRNWLQRKWAI